MAARHERDDVAPEVTRRREAVEKHDGYAGAARSGGVVVDPRAAKIEKLTAHAKLYQETASGREDVGLSAWSLVGERNAGRHFRDGPRCPTSTASVESD